MKKIKRHFPLKMYPKKRSPKNCIRLQFEIGNPFEIDWEQKKNPEIIPKCGKREVWNHF